MLVTRQQLGTALNIQKALLAHPTASMLLTHPSRAVEVSYFGFDEETGWKFVCARTSRSTSTVCVSAQT